MLKLKVVLLLAAVLRCVFASNGMDSEGIPSQAADHVISTVNSEVKINWGPVWDDIEGNNEFVQKNLEGDVEEDNQQNCNAPNGLGLQNLLQEIEKILPKQQIKAIVKSYSEDPEIKALKAFISNPKTLESVKAIRNSQDYQILKDYSCRVLHIDLIKYNKLAKILIKPLLTRTNTQSPKGIRGLINEVNGILPRQQLHELYQNLLASDDELVKAVANLKSKEYQQLLSNVKNNVPEYKVLRQQLKDLGVPVEEIREVLDNAFGWKNELNLLV